VAVDFGAGAFQMIMANGMERRCSRTALDGQRSRTGGTQVALACANKKLS
jgi:hypothetical protein